MNTNQLQKNVKQYEKTVRDELQNLSNIISQINLKQFNNENANSEIKRYNKSLAKYKKAYKNLSTNIKFLKAQNFMSFEEEMELDKLLESFELEFKETTKYVNLHL